MVTKNNGKISVGGIRNTVRTNEANDTAAKIDNHGSAFATFAATVS
jgi:hypothetical protein